MLIGFFQIFCENNMLWLWNVADWEESRGFRLQNPIFSSFQISRTLCPKAVRKLLILAYVRTEILFVPHFLHPLTRKHPFPLSLSYPEHTLFSQVLQTKPEQGWPTKNARMTPSFILYKHMFTSFLNKNTTLFKRIIFYKYLFVGLHTYELGDIPTRFSCLWPRTQTDGFALNILYLWPSDWYY